MGIFRVNLVNNSCSTGHQGQKAKFFLGDLRHLALFMYSVYLLIYSSHSLRPCDSRNLALSPLCSLEGLQSLPWVDDAEQVYNVISGQIPQFLTQMEGRLVATHLI